MRAIKFKKHCFGILSRSVDFITDSLAIIAAVLTVLLVGVVTISVLLRYVFALSVGWSTELTELLIFTIVMLAAPWVLKIDAHISLDLFLHKMRGRTKKCVSIVNNIIAAIVCLSFCYFSIIVAQKSFIDGDVLPGTLLVPKYSVILFVMIMFLICGCLFFKRFISNVRQRV